MNHSLPKQIPIDPCIREMKKTRITLPWQGTLNMRSIVIRTIDVWQNVMKNWNPTWPMKISTSLTPVVERIPIFMNCTPKIIHEFLQIRTSHKVTINKTLLSFTDKNTSITKNWTRKIKKKNYDIIRPGAMDSLYCVSFWP